MAQKKERIHQKDNLHSLIRDLSGSEKRFFTIFLRNSAGRKHQNYRVLFKALVGMEVYNRKRLVEKLKGHSFVKHLNPTKSRLLDLILKSLRAQEIKKTIDSDLQDQLANIDLLIGRMHYSLARLKINQARKLASQTERYKVLLALLDLEIWLFSAKREGDPLVFFKEMEAERIRVLELIGQNSILYALQEKMRVFSQRFVYGRKDAKTAAPFEEIIHHPILQGPAPTPSVLGYSYHQHIWGMYFIRTGKHQEGVTLYKTVIEKWESKPELKKTESSLYLGMVNNYLTVLHQFTAHSNSFLPELRRLRSLSKLSHGAQMKLDRITYFQEFNHQMNYGSFVDGKALADEITTWLNKNEEFIARSRRLLFELSFSFFFFAYGEYARANLHLLNIIHFPGRQERKDIRDFAPLLRLIVQYELEDFDYSEYLVRSADRYLRRNQTLFSYEDALISYMRAVQQLPPGRGGRKELAKALKHRLDEIEQEEGENLIGLAILRGVWLESKLKEVPVRTLFESIVKINRQGLEASTQQEE